MEHTQNTTIKGSIIEDEAPKKRKFKYNPEIAKKALIFSGTAICTFAGIMILSRTQLFEEGVLTGEDPNVVIGDLVENEDGSTSFTVTEYPETPSE